MNRVDLIPWILRLHSLIVDFLILDLFVQLVIFFLTHLFFALLDLWWNALLWGSRDCDLLVLEDLGDFWFFRGRNDCLARVVVIESLDVLELFFCGCGFDFGWLFLYVVLEPFIVIFLQLLVIIVRTIVLVIVIVVILLVDFLLDLVLAILAGFDWSFVNVSVLHWLVDCLYVGMVLLVDGRWRLFGHHLVDRF